MHQHNPEWISQLINEVRELETLVVDLRFKFENFDDFRRWFWILESLECTKWIRNAFRTWFLCFRDQEIIRNHHYSTKWATSETRINTPWPGGDQEVLLIMSRCSYFWFLVLKMFRAKVLVFVAKILITKTKNPKLPSASRRILFLYNFIPPWIFLVHSFFIQMVKGISLPFLINFHSFLFSKYFDKTFWIVCQKI